VLRITIDATVLTGQSRRSGLGHYTHNLLAALADRDDIAVTAIATDDASLPAGVGRHPARRLGRTRFEALDAAARFGIDARRAGGDVFHVPAGLPPVLPPRPWVHTLHDVIPLVATEGEHPSSRRQWRTLGRLMRRADAVVAVSRFAAETGSSALGLDPERVVVIPHGVDPRFQPATPPESIGPPHLLVVGELSRRKGFDRAVAVVDALAERGYPHQLRIVGNVPAAGRRVLDDVLASARHPERMVVAGYVDDLPTAYQSATAFLAISRYEGFGLPAAEAMACGTPVLGFAATATAEVVGDGGVLVADGDIRSLTEVVAELIDRPDVAAALRARALRRAAVFTWPRAAAQYLEVYRRVSDDKGSR
jgi:alpha-1,3-rhamnosyl/mannosyltransferase